MEGFKKETTALIKEAKRNFYNKYVEMTKKSNNLSLYYRAVSRLKTSERTESFSPAELYPGKTEQEASECVADFFTKIAQNFDSLRSTEEFEKSLPNECLTVTKDEVKKESSIVKKNSLVTSG